MTPAPYWLFKNITPKTSIGFHMCIYHKVGKEVRQEMRRHLQKASPQDRPHTRVHTDAHTRKEKSDWFLKFHIFCGQVHCLGKRFAQAVPISTSTQADQCNGGSGIRCRSLQILTLIEQKTLNRKKLTKMLGKGPEDSSPWSTLSAYDEADTQCNFIMRRFPRRRTGAV